MAKKSKRHFPNGSTYFNKSKKEDERHQEQMQGRQQAIDELKRLIDDKPDLRTADDINHLAAYQKQMELDEEAIAIAMAGGEEED